MKVRVKNGHKAFIGGALRTAGYVADVPGKTVPFWAEKVEASKAKPKGGGSKPKDETVSFDTPPDEGSDNTVTL